jgi:hypothetical protein
MTTEQHTALLSELIRIREALESRSNTPSAPKPTASKSTWSDSLPAPDYQVENAGAVAVHFGKNSGIPISSLTDKQLLWYGADREPQLKSDGTPFAPREADVLLKNACRTLWHSRRTGAVAPVKSVSASDDAHVISEEVPF